MGQDANATFVFGTIYQQSKNFQQFFYIDGVVGFIADGGSAFGGTSAFQRLVDTGQYANIFAMCLNPYSGGVLTLGGTDASLQTGPFAWTPIAFGLGYSVDMSDIEVNGQSIGIKGTHPVIVDSGTNIFLQPSDHYSALYRFFQSTLCPGFPLEGVCGQKNLFTHNCYNYNETDLALFPNISLVLRGATLTVTGQQYLITNSTGSGLYCLGIDETGVEGISIIGDVIMQAYYVAFDVTHKRLGWAPVNQEACMKQAASASPTISL